MQPTHIFSVNLSDLYKRPLILSLLRMFSIGIGQGASTSLVTGIARAGNGKAEFVYGTDRLQAKVRHTYDVSSMARKKDTL